MKTFNEIHAVNVLGGITFQRTIFDNLTTTTTGLEIESLDEESLSSEQIFYRRKILILIIL